ncbi:MAG: hypothetical protein ACM3QV_00110, partial [Caulobacteraceae bacterium]
TLQFTITGSSGTFAGVSVAGSPTAITSKIEVGVIKMQVPGDGGNNDWTFTPHVSNINIDSDSDGIDDTTGQPVDDITYELKTVTLYVSRVASKTATPSASDLNAPVETFQYPGQDIDDNTYSEWTHAPESLNNFDGIPIGFIRPDISIKDTVSGGSYTQFPRTYVTQEGNVRLITQVWVVNGYFIQATKTITEDPYTPNVYHVMLNVSNLGTKKSPKHVIVYDIVPSAFDGPDNISFIDSVEPSLIHVIDAEHKYTGKTATSVTISGVNGYSYWWDVDRLDAKGESRDHVSISYTIAGNGDDYPMSDLYLVGIDPAQTYNMQAAPLLENVSTIMNSNVEPALAIGALGVFMLGMFGTIRRRY